AERVCYAPAVEADVPGADIGYVCVVVALLPASGKIPGRQVKGGGVPEEPGDLRSDSVPVVSTDLVPVPVKHEEPGRADGCHDLQPLGRAGPAEAFVAFLVAVHAHGPGAEHLRAASGTLDTGPSQEVLCLKPVYEVCATRANLDLERAGGAEVIDRCRRDRWQ